MDTIKQRLRMTLAGCFASLPLHDPALLHKGATVNAAEERPDERLVTSNGVCSGDTTVLHFARDTGLPHSIELPQMLIRARSGSRRDWTRRPGRSHPRGAPPRSRSAGRS